MKGLLLGVVLGAGVALATLWVLGQSDLIDTNRRPEILYIPDEPFFRVPGWQPWRKV